MTEKHSLIYVRGLGSPKGDKYQRAAINAWSIYGFTVRFFPNDWSTAERWPDKKARLLHEIDTLSATSDRLTLVGVSAGTSAVLNAFHDRAEDIDSVVCVSGKATNIDTRKPDRRLRANPAYKHSLEELQESLPDLSDENRRRILTVKPLWDGVVPVPDMQIDGAQELIVPMVGHIAGIATALVPASGLIARHI